MKHIRFLPLWLLVPLLLPVGCGSAAAAPVPKSGAFVRVIEAEYFPTKGKFTEGRDEANKVVYLAHEEGSRELKENEAMVHSFSVPASDTYYLWGRIWVQNDAADSVFVRVGAGRSTWVIEHEPKDIKFHSQGDWVIWNHMARKEHRKWIWARVGSLTQPKNPTYVAMAFKLEAGRHRICIAGREAGARIDKLLVTNDAALVPAGPTGVTVAPPPAATSKSAPAKHSTPPPPPELIRPLILHTAFARPNLQLAATLPLTAATASPAEARRTAKGGKFRADGWQATSAQDRLLIELKDGFGAAQSGAIEVDVANFNPRAQASGKKHHFITFHGDSGGNAFTSRQTPFFTIRAGSEYKDAAGNLGIKMLWRGGSGRGEETLFGARSWDPATTYVWRCEWNRQALCVYVNGERIFGPAEFNDRFPAPLKYLFLSTDGIDGEEYKYWFGMVGPVYRAVRVYR